MGEYIVAVPVRGVEYRTVQAKSKAEAMRKVDAGDGDEHLDLHILSWAKPSSAKVADIRDASSEVPHG